MKPWESILLALALCVDSLAVSTTCTLRSKTRWSRGMLLAFTFALFQGGFPLLGALLGKAFKEVIDVVDHWIAFALLSLVGIKMIWDAFHPDDDRGHTDISRYGVICTLAVATSIDAFVVGIGFGMGYTLAQSVLTCLIISVVTFLASLSGVFLGKRNVPIPDKWASMLAGITLIGLGVKTLIEHGVMG